MHTLATTYDSEEVKPKVKRYYFDEVPADVAIASIETPTRPYVFRGAYLHFSLATLMFLFSFRRYIVKDFRKEYSNSKHFFGKLKGAYYNASTSNRAYAYNVHTTKRQRFESKSKNPAKAADYPSKEMSLRDFLLKSYYAHTHRFVLYDIGLQELSGAPHNYTFKPTFLPDTFTNYFDIYSDKSHNTAYVAEPNTCTPAHVDSGMTSGFMFLLEGKKLWWFCPPDKKARKYFRNHFIPKGDANTPEYTATNALIHKIPKGAAKHKIQCILQRAGDLMFVPPGWMHAVRNLTYTIGVGDSFLTPRSLIHQRDFFAIDEHHDMVRTLVYYYPNHDLNNMCTDLISHHQDYGIEFEQLRAFMVALKKAFDSAIEAAKEKNQVIPILPKAVKDFYKINCTSR